MGVIKKIVGKVTIARNSNGRMSIQVVDSASKLQVIDIDMDLTLFAMALTGIARQEAECEVNIDPDIGQLLVREPRSVVVPGSVPTEQREKYLLEHCKEDGWRVDPYLRSQNSVQHVPEGVRLNYHVYKYVDSVASRKRIRR